MDETRPGPPSGIYEFPVPFAVAVPDGYSVATTAGADPEPGRRRPGRPPREPRRPPRPDK